MKGHHRGVEGGERGLFVILYRNFWSNSCKTGKSPLQKLEIQRGGQKLDSSNLDIYLDIVIT